MAIDFEQDLDDKINLSDENVNTISMLATQQLEFEATINEMEDEVKALKKRLRKVSEEDLPGAMLVAGVSEIKLSDGAVVSIKKDLFPTIPKPKTLLAYSWLRNNGHGSIIKNNVTIQFGMGEDEKATTLLTQLTDGGYNPVQKESVHAGTLKSFVKEQVADPETQDLPEDLFTVFEVSKSVIKLS